MTPEEIAAKYINHEVFCKVLPGRILPGKCTCHAEKYRAELAADIQRFSIAVNEVRYNTKTYSEEDWDPPILEMLVTLFHDD